MNTKILRHEVSSESSTPIFHPWDGVVAGILLAVSIFLYVQTYYFEEVSAFVAQNVGPEEIPRGLLIAIIAMSLIVPFERWIRRGKHSLDQKGRVKPIVFLTIFMLVGLVALHETLGTWLLLTAVCVVLPLAWGERRWLPLGIYVAVFPLLVSLLFGVVLDVVLEPGIFDLKFY
ncbi:MAG: tripartite tricarboxylate transporter TctB family protein [Verrucomicrobia bacterium]|nr:tripartite tricarboxylate transporter TctB family protein [Verrucomicrobiota bacterium]